MPEMIRPVAGLTLAATLLLLSGCSEPESSAWRPGAAAETAPPLADAARSDWRASTFTLSSQSEAVLAADGADELVVCWSSRRQQGGRYGVYAQRFDRDGVALGEETALAIWNKSHQTAPALTSDGRGGYWAAWTSHNQDGSLGSIIARHFNSDFVGGDEILVNERTEGHQSDPVLAATADGGVLVAYLSTNLETKRQMLKARRLSATGTPVADEVVLAGVENGDVRVPSLAAGANGYALAYSLFENGAPAGIHLQMLDSAGAPRGAARTISGPARLSQIEPVVAAHDGGYIVSWVDAETDGDGYGVVARLVTADGEPITQPFQVNERAAGTQSAPAIAGQADGSFVIAYNSDDDSEGGVYARRFDGAGNPLGDEFAITARSEGKQLMQQARGTQRLVRLGDRLACAWSGEGGFGDSSAVHVSLLSPEPITLADGQVQGVRDDMQPAAYDASDVAETSAASPHVPPTFDPRDISDADREIVRTDRGIGFTGIASTGWTPPDPHLGVGPDHIVAMTNGAIAFFTKDGTLTFQDEIEDSFGFWGSVGATGFVFDPEVLYDELSGRFFAMAAEAYAPGNRSYVLVAVSDDSDPNGTWYKYRFDTTNFAGNLFDSPNMAVDDDVLYITGDGFGLGANYPVYTFDKASLLAGDPPAITRSTTLSTATQSAGIPPVGYDDPPALYMVEHEEGFNNNGVRLIALTDPLGSITFDTFTLTVPVYNNPGDPAQLGTTSRPESFDARFWSVEYRNGSLWATHHVDNPVEIRWYEIAMNGWPASGDTPSLVQSGAVTEPGLFTSFTSIAVDDAGNAALCFSRSAFDEYFSMATTYRLADDPPGTMRPIVIQQQSTSPETSGRWGDYSGIEYDSAANQFWAHHEYRTNVWRTWIRSIDDLPTPCPGDFNNDGQRDQADLGILLASYGVDDGGDMNGDGSTDQADLGAFLAPDVFGAPCP